MIKKTGIMTVLAAAGLAAALHATAQAQVSTKRLTLPGKQAPSQMEASAQAKVPDTVPGSLPDLNNKLNALTERFNKLETDMDQRLRRIENALNEIKNEQARLKANTRAPQCSADESHSTNPVNGASDDCKPYACNPVSGLCRLSCATTTDCVRGAVCDPDGKKCIWADGK
jgi:hypothetical protein